MAELSEAETVAIEWACARLINLYASLNDEGRWEEVAELYAEDGTMTRPTAPEAPLVGREAILAAFKARPPRVTRHMTGNIVVTVESGTTARATSTMLLFSGEAGSDSTLPKLDARSPLVGTFADRFVRTGEGWRFAERRGSLTFGAA